jgi:hypothetical protein
MEMLAKTEEPIVVQQELASVSVQLGIREDIVKMLIIA